MKTVKIAAKSWKLVDIAEIGKNLQNNAEKCQDIENRGIRMVRGDIASTTVAKH